MGFFVNVTFKNSYFFFEDFDVVQRSYWHGTSLNRKFYMGFRLNGKEEERLVKKFDFWVSALICNIYTMWRLESKRVRIVGRKLIDKAAVHNDRVNMILNYFFTVINSLIVLFLTMFIIILNTYYYR